MNSHDLPSPPPGMMAVRAGCLLAYKVQKPTLALLMFMPRACPEHLVVEDQLSVSNGMPVERLVDAHGNVLLKTTLQPGVNEYRHDAVYFVTAERDNHGLPSEGNCDICPLPTEVLRYTLPSRYCESDKLQTFAREKFGHLQRTAEQVEAICNWTHTHIEYRYGSGSSTLSACDIIQRGYGVCRDFAHVMIALCRALDIPARYVGGHMPYIGAAEGDIGVDFHAYCEVYVDGHWRIFDARYNKPHAGRIKIAHGMDAVDAAIATIYGDAAFVTFQVWAYQVDHTLEHVGDPVALRKTEEGRPLMTRAFSAAAA